RAGRATTGPTLFPYTTLFRSTAAFGPDDVERIRAAASDAQASGADLTYELSGNPRAIDLAIEVTGDYGRIVVGSWYGNKPAEVKDRKSTRLNSSHVKISYAVF